MELGLYTFADVSPEPGPQPDPSAVGPHERLRDLIEEIELADQVGLDVFGLGEHHRPDYASSAPAVVLAAAAERTRRIRLTSAVTVLSSDDPVRVFQQFSTLDLLSSGRAEIMAGRGSFIESFPLFGYNLEDYDELFAEKLDLLLAIRDQVKVTWSGRLRAPINGRGVYPRPFQEKLPIWIAIGGTPQSAARAGALGLPLALAIIGGEPHRFAPLFNLYREAAKKFGRDPATLKTSINVHGFVAETSQEAIHTAFPPHADVMNRIGRERGWGASITRAEFAASAEPLGANFAGSPAQVTDKILANHEIFGFDRFVLQMAIGVMDHAKLMKAIELYGTKVAPEVRKAVAARKAEPAGA